MPIKFKCSCGHILKVPDKLAGKSGKCPKCQKVLKVPVPKAKQPQPKQAAAVAATGGTAPSPGGKLDSLFDEAGLVQKSGPVCPKCGADIKPGTVVCTSCGFHLETGEQISGFNVNVEGPEFDNLYLQEAADNMRRDSRMDDRRSKAAMPWWVLMSFLIGAITLCAAGVVIVDGRFGTPADETTFIGKVQRLPVFVVLGMTAGITGIAITAFAHLSICFFAFTRHVGQGLACLFLPLIFSVVYGIMHWTDNKAPVKAIIMALIFIGLGIAMIVKGGGFGEIQAIF